MYDLIIIGGGPAAVAAGVYAARKKIKNILITESIGGQSVVAETIHNWIGAKTISGVELAKLFRDHLESVGQEMILNEKVSKVDKIAEGFEIETAKGKKFQTKTVIIANGSRRRQLGVPGEEKFVGKGVSYCATCDAPFFNGMDVVVVGAGNAGLEGVLQLKPYAKKIYLITHSGEMRGDKETQEKILAFEPKIEIIYNAEVSEVKGEKFVQVLAYKDKISGENKEISVGGILVEIGSVPNFEIVKGLVDIDSRGQIIVDCKTQATSVRGIFAAGDITDALYRQNNIAVGDGIKALMSVERYLFSNSK